MALRVLLADESSTIKRVFEIGLKDFNLEIRNVQHGIDVIEVAEGFQPDIIFADVLVSKMNGYEVCSQIKQHDQLSTIPVVLMWSGFMDIDEDKYTRCQADGRLEKPFSTEELRSKIQSLVARTLENQVASHLKFPSPSGNSEENSEKLSRVVRKKDPTEDLLYKEDLPLSTDAHDEEDFDLQPFNPDLDSSGLDASHQDTSDFETTDGSEDFSLDLDEDLNNKNFANENMDEPFNLDGSQASEENDDEDFGDGDEDLGLDGFQALDITGSYNTESGQNDWSSDFSDFQSDFKIDHPEEDNVPLDFNPPSPDFEADEDEDIYAQSANSDAGFMSLDEEVNDQEITEVPSLEEEAQLLEKANADNQQRQNIYPFQKEPSQKPEQVSNIKHRSIDDLSAKSKTPPPPPKGASQKLSAVVSEEDLRQMVKKEAQEMLQNMVWEIVPELAKQLIEKELKRLLAEEDPPPPATQ